MNEALKNILERNSHRNLVEPIPSKDEMEKVFQAALRAPDHAWLRPSSFIQISGDGLQRLSDIFVDFAEENFDDLTEERIEKYRNAPFRAPLIVVLVSTKKDHPKVPRNGANNINRNSRTKHYACIKRIRIWSNLENWKFCI